MYDLAVWPEKGHVSVAEARQHYIELASAAQTHRGTTQAVESFMAAFEACFPDTRRDALDAVPGSRNVFIPALRGECYVLPAGAYLSFPTDLAPDITPVVCHLADQCGLVVYDRQREAVWFPSSMEYTWRLRVTAGDGFVVAIDPAPGDLAPILDAADQSEWFRILERDPAHYLQAAPEGLATGTEPRTWIIECRDGDAMTHFISRGVPLSDVKRAFERYAAGESSWKNGFTWSPLVS